MRKAVKNFNILTTSLSVL